MSLFSLRVGEAARYEWGSCFITFSYAPLGKALQMEILNTLWDQEAKWQTPGEFRSTVAFVHELTHYLQDVNTGIGHWDHLKRLAFLKKLSLRSERFVPNAENQNTWLEELVFVPNSLWPKSRTDGFKEQTHSILRWDREGASSEPPYTPENLLEAEAMASVFLQLRNLKASSEQRQIAYDQDWLFHPGRMQDAYQIVLENFVSLMSHVADEDIGKRVTEGESGLQLLDGLLIWLLFFIDVSLAYPTPAMITERRYSRDHYEPGVKLARLFSTFASFNETQHALLADAFYKPDLDKAEAILLAATQQRYPHSRDVYLHWKHTLEQQLGKNSDYDQQILETRIFACENRLEKGAQYRTFANATLPDRKFFPPILSASGLTYLTINDEFLLSHEEQSARRDRMLLHGVVRTLQDAIMTRQTFACPIRVLCKAAVSLCQQGHQSKETFPEDGCAARDEVRYYNLSF